MYHLWGQGITLKNQSFVLMINFVTQVVTYRTSCGQSFAAKHGGCYDNPMFFFFFGAFQILIWMSVKVMPARQVLFSYTSPFVTNLFFRWEKENECSRNVETQWEKWMFSFWKVDIFFWGGGAKNTHISVPSRYATLITHLTLLPGVSSSLSEWLTCLSVLGWKQEPCPPFWGVTTDWHVECLFPPLLMSICVANCNRISFSWTAYFGGIFACG